MSLKREKPLVWVAYDTSETDKSCVVCTEPNNGMAKMLVGYIGSDADEVYKIVSEQGYLSRHDKEVRNKTIEEVIGIVNARLVIGLGLENATKYGNVNSKQQTNSYSTLMRYEIADAVEDLFDDIEQMKEGGKDG